MTTWTEETVREACNRGWGLRSAREKPPAQIAASRIQDGEWFYVLVTEDGAKLLFIGPYTAADTAAYLNKWEYRPCTAA